jgi:Zn-dependent metalloprotease
MDPAAIAKADKALSEHPAAVAASSSDAFDVYSTRTDADGASHVRYTRTYHGLRVFGGDIVVHLNADGSFAGASSGLAQQLTLQVQPKFGADSAEAAAQASFTGRVTSTGAAQLLIDASSGEGRLAWEAVVSGMRPDGQTPSRLHVVVDALSGGVLGSFDEIESVDGTGSGLYAPAVMSTTLAGSYVTIDPTHGNGNTCDMNNGTTTCINFTDTDNVWGDGTQTNRQSAGVDAHYGAAVTFDYFMNVHGRNGIFGNGAGVPSRVHYGNNYVNAFWDGAQLTYGDGSGNARPLVSLDIVGHEISHGVTGNVVPGGLIYSGESGGLNEATSDIFGSMVEFYANTQYDPGEYLVGEKVNVRGNGTPIRYMYDPPLDGVSHGCWSSATDGVNVHYSSGVGNHFFFNLVQGTGIPGYGTSPLCGGAPAVVGIGRAKAEKIWFRALDIYFTSSTRYVNTSNPANTSRAYTLSAARDLHGPCSIEYKAVQAAWTSVNVAGSDSACRPPRGPDVEVSPEPTLRN